MYVKDVTVTLLCIESPVCTFDTSDMSYIALYWGACIHFWHLRHELHCSVLRGHVYTFDTSNMSNIALYWGALYALSTPSTWVTLLCIESPLCTFDTPDMSNIALYWGACPLNYTVDPNYNKIWLKALNYFELETLRIR